MGTRGLVGFRHRGERKGSYNHCDSYPSDLGSRIVRFLLTLNDADIALMLQRTSKLTWIVDEDSTPPPELQARYQAAGLYDGSVNKGTPADWYCLLRGAQMGECLRYSLDGTLEHMLDASEFAEDRSCNYMYFIDFEERVLEVAWWGPEREKVVREVRFGELDEKTMDQVVEQENELWEAHEKAEEAKTEV